MNHSSTSSTTTGRPGPASGEAHQQDFTHCIQACLDMCVQYAGERTTMGGPIGRKQGVAFQIADLEVMLQASRMLTYRAAAMKDAGAPVFGYGAFIQTIIDFVIIAFAIFLVVKLMNKFIRKAGEAPPPAPPEDVVLLREIRDALVQRG